MKKKITDIKLNPSNPRFIRDEKFERLKKSIIDFPQMLEARPIVIDEKGIILGGNMRFRAIKELGHKEVDVTVIKGLTGDQKREFVIKDNSSFGEWDWEVLANEWADLPLKEWGIDGINDEWSNLPPIEGDHTNPLDLPDVFKVSVKDAELETVKASVKEYIKKKYPSCEVI